MARSHTPSSTLPVSGGQVHGRSLATNLLLALRPGQWTKNLVVFAGLIFAGADRTRQTPFQPVEHVATAAAAFGLFCLLSGIVYLINDIHDREADRLHPEKSARPIASGALSVGAAATAAVVLAVFTLTASFALDRGFGFVAVSYLTLLGLYSFGLKHSPVLDVLAIAFGFVLRALAGAVVLHVEFSNWLLVLTLLLALFLAIGKRRGELAGLAGEAARHRPSLTHYTLPMLDQMLAVVMACTLLAYAFYTISAETVSKFGTDHLLFTLPLPIYGLFRFLYLIHRGTGGGNPTDLLLSDRPLQLCVVLWAALVAAIIYYGPLK
jgi:4-hydroxybenzoate polyprenyltransferase